MASIASLYGPDCLAGASASVPPPPPPPAAHSGVASTAQATNAIVRRVGCGMGFPFTARRSECSIRSSAAKHSDTADASPLLWTRVCAAGAQVGGQPRGCTVNNAVRNPVDSHLELDRQPPPAAK